MDELDIVLGNIPFSVLEGYGLTGRAWAFPFSQIRVLDLTSWAFVWTVVKGHGCGAEPIALLGWLVGSGPFSYPHQLKINFILFY